MQLSLMTPYSLVPLFLGASLPQNIAVFQLHSHKQCLFSEHFESWTLALCWQNYRVFIMQRILDSHVHEGLGWRQSCSLDLVLLQEHPMAVILRSRSLLLWRMLCSSFLLEYLLLTIIATDHLLSSWQHQISNLHSVHFWRFSWAFLWLKSNSIERCFCFHLFVYLAEYFWTRVDLAQSS